MKYVLDSISDAVTSVLGWTAVIAATITLGFCAGYLTGHGGHMTIERTLAAYVRLPIIWIGSWEVLMAWVVALVTWYLPLKYGRPAIQGTFALTNFLVWMIAVEVVVVKAADSKFFQF